MSPFTIHHPPSTIHHPPSTIPSYLGSDSQLVVHVYTISLYFELDFFLVVYSCTLRMAEGAISVTVTVCIVSPWYSYLGLSLGVYHDIVCCVLSLSSSQRALCVCVYVLSLSSADVCCVCCLCRHDTCIVCVRMCCLCRQLMCVCVCISLASYPALSLSLSLCMYVIWAVIPNVVHSAPGVVSCSGGAVVSSRLIPSHPIPSHPRVRCSVM